MRLSDEKHARKILADTKNTQERKIKKSFTGPYESEGRGFESLPAHQVKSYIQSNLDVAFNFLFYIVSASCYSRHGALFMSVQIHSKRSTIAVL